jgi:putative transcriptional regulator
VKISHHLDDATVVAYAAATLPDAHMLVVASHLAFCQTCQRSVREAEAVGGGIMMQQDAAVVSDVCRSATLASLDGLITAPVPQRAKLQGELPVPLARILGDKVLADLPWKKKAPGLSIYEVPMNDEARGRLLFLNITPGSSMPEHGHAGEELTLVLKGAYTDRFGTFAAGDIADLDEEIEHKPVTDAKDGCICVVALEAPTVFKPFWARLLQPFIGI